MREVLSPQEPGRIRLRVEPDVWLPPNAIRPTTAARSCFERLLELFIIHYTSLETPQGQIDGFLGQLPFKCFLPEEAFMGNRLKICL